MPQPHIVVYYRYFVSKLQRKRILTSVCRDTHMQSNTRHSSVCVRINDLCKKCRKFIMYVITSPETCKTLPDLYIPAYIIHICSYIVERWTNNNLYAKIYTQNFYGIAHLNFTIYSKNIKDKNLSNNLLIKIISNEDWFQGSLSTTKKFISWRKPMNW